MFRQIYAHQLHDTSPFRRSQHIDLFGGHREDLDQHSLESIRQLLIERRNRNKKVALFDLRASSGDAAAIPWQPALELVAPQEVVDDAEGIPGFDGSDVREDRDAEEGILGIAAVAVAAV